MNGTSIGFSADVKDNRKEGDLSLTTPDDLVKFGMIPEFIGRFTTTVSISELTKEQLKKVLVDVKNSYIDQYKYLFTIDNIELNFEDEALDQIVDNCLMLKTGARGLHTEIERVLMPHMFNTRDYRENNVKQINITRNLVLEPKKII
jgi:ATP-dependent Clp protease ATP-binding subunit ClpX